MHLRGAAAARSSRSPRSHSRVRLEHPGAVDRRFMRLATPILLVATVVPAFAQPVLSSSPPQPGECSSAKACTEQANAARQRADHAASFRLFQRACDLKDDLACWNVGSMLQQGQGAAKDVARAMAIYDRVCGAGVHGACINLGAIYVQGTDVKADYAKALQYFTKACDARAWRGCAQLGVMHSFGLGVPKDPKEGARFYRRACDGGVKEACAMAAPAAAAPAKSPLPSAPAAPPQPPRTAPAPPAARFYCADPGSVCWRKQTECDAVVATLAKSDYPARCQAQRTAACFDVAGKEGCFSLLFGCEDARKRAIDGGKSPTPCELRK